MEDRILELEYQLANLTKMAEDLSDVVARQDKAILQLERRVRMLMEREAEREADVGNTIPLGDQKPPHW